MLLPHPLPFRDAFAGHRLPHAVVEITHADLVLGAQGTALEDAGLEIGLRAFADAEILAHDVAVGLDRALVLLLHHRADVAEEEAVDDARAVLGDRHDARAVHAAGIDRQGEVRPAPQPKAAIDRAALLRRGHDDQSIAVGSL